MEDREDIIDQIRRIMRLSERAGTDGEKCAADAAIKRLAVRHGINLDEVKATDSDIKTEFFSDEEWHNYPKTELGYVTAVLRQHFGIVLIQRKSGRKVSFQWVGTKLNVDIARHVTVLLMRAVTRDWRNALLGKRLAKDIVRTGRRAEGVSETGIVALANLNKRAFLDGWFWTIHQKLNEHPLRNDREQFEAERKRAEEMFERMKSEQNIAERRRRSSVDESDREAVLIGHEAAKAVNLSRPCACGGYCGSPMAIGVAK